MESSAFDEETGVLDPPPGVSNEDCASLSVWQGELSDGVRGVISCWKPSPEEMAEIQRTGRVWLLIWGRTMPPAYVSGTYPFVKPQEESPS